LTNSFQYSFYQDVSGMSMNPSEWLEKNVLGFSLLSGQEREAIKDFSLLWSLYEGTILNASGSAKAIIHAVDSLKASGRLTVEVLRGAIDYFVERYFDGDLTYAFHELRLRSNDHRALVEKVLKGQSTDDSEIASAILIIVFRLRNNLFHGVKWSYGIRGQLENFHNANNVLMSVIEMHQR
jgi:hypothetical protein